MKTCTSCRGRKTHHNPSTHEDETCLNCKGAGQLPDAPEPPRYPPIKDGEMVSKADEVPMGPHWAFLEFDYPNREDGYGGTGPELDLKYRAFGSEEVLRVYVARHLARPYPALYAVLRVEGRLIAQQQVTFSLGKP